MPRPRHTEAPRHRTKIVATLGPATTAKEVLHALVLAGADVFRLNFSHGTHEEHRNRINILREIGQEMGRPFALLGDLSGPKLRIAGLAGPGVPLEDNDQIVLTSGEADGTGNRFGVSFAGFHEVARPGEKILIDDGNIAVMVDHVDGQNVYCTVLDGGLLKPRKGVNLPDTRLPIPALTEKDRADMKFALEAGVDLLALSFVRSPIDIQVAREAMREFGREVPILAKIEKKEAVDNLVDILKTADGAMVARGDLGIEIPMEQVPAIQKQIIRLSNRLSHPVITATQMLESMMDSPRPTRAEVTDVYNAILDGTDAIMLSGETAAGRYPVEAVETMRTVALEAERALGDIYRASGAMELGDHPSVTQSICQSAVRVAESLRLDLIIVPTETGYSAFHVARFKPSMPIFACSVNTDSVNRLCLAWGVTSRTMSRLDEGEVARSETDALINEVIRTAKYHGIARSGQRAVVIGGVPLGKTRHTNYLHVMEIK